MEVKGYPNYLVYDDGTIFSKTRNKFLEPSFRGENYKAVCLYNEGKKKMFYIHRLVASHYLENPCNYECVHHKDNDRTNNNLENLEWCNQMYNSQSFRKKDVSVGCVVKAIRKNKPLAYRGRFIYYGKAFYTPTRETKEEVRNELNCYLEKIKQDIKDEKQDRN